MTKIVWTATKRKAFAEKMRLARARKKNPAKAKLLKTNPKKRGGFLKDSFAIVAKRGSTSLWFDGRHFSSKGNAHRFLTQLAAKVMGRQMLRKYPVLRTYKLYVARV